MDSSDIQSSSLGQKDEEASTSQIKQGSLPCREDYKYDVFLSFRGTDTRNNFVDHLYNHLTNKGIFVFKDDKTLEEGQPISSQLVQAIKASRISIVVFSRDYPGSRWCLEELATIVECQKELMKHNVFPVFYNVDPSTVRKQTEEYRDAFDAQAKRFKYDPNKVERWKRVMSEVGNLVGWDIRDKPEFEEINKIVQKVIKTLGHKLSGYGNDLVGVQHRVEELEKLLQSEDDGFRVVGMCGMGGIGKTTLAAVLYNKISYKFDACCFIENASKSQSDGGVVAIHKQILHQTLGEHNLDAYSSFEINGKIRRRLSRIKVLIVLDNVDDHEQLKQLAKEDGLFGKGSRMIITTRDEHILQVYGVNDIYRVPILNDNDAHELFCSKAFTRDNPSRDSVTNPTSEILNYVQGLPLAIIVIGRSLYRKGATNWENALEWLKNNAEKGILDVLRISFEELKDKEKQIFLHIACFFAGDREDYVKQVLHYCELLPDVGINILKDKSLITIRNQEIHMHEQLQELGKEIVRENHRRKPALWTRLWLFKDFQDALMSESETNNVEAVVQNQKENVSEHTDLRIKGLSKMKDLSLLILYQNDNFVGSLDTLSHNLKYLSWDGYPFSSLPSSFEPYKLVALNLRGSTIKRLCEGLKKFPCLKMMDLSNSKDLTELPDFGLSPNVKRLDLSGCTSLVRVHPSIGLLTKLAYLSLQNCTSLVSIDFGAKCRLSSLEVLHLSNCKQLQSTPDFTGLTNLEFLDLKGCVKLARVHESIGALKMLKFLSLHSNSLHDLPPRQNFMPSSNLESLISLDLGFCNLREIPDSIGELRCLERLNLEGNNFTSLPNSTKKLLRLAYLNLTRCSDLSTLPELPIDSDPSGGRYFQSVSTSRNHRSGLHLYGCKRVMESNLMQAALSWLARLIENPCHFRCGFEILVPARGKIPEWFIHRFDGGSIISILDSDVDDNWLGFAFCVEFLVDNMPFYSRKNSNSLYLSFENEHTEECFDSPPYLLDRDFGRPYMSLSTHQWIIYISRVHCHFVKTGAHIGFKARPPFKIRRWGFRMVFKQDIEMLRGKSHGQNSYDMLNIEIVEGSSKIQLPYNWLVSDEEEAEKMNARIKEDNLSNAGLKDT